MHDRHSTVAVGDATPEVRAQEAPEHEGRRQVTRVEACTRILWSCRWIHKAAVGRGVRLIDTLESGEEIPNLSFRMHPRLARNTAQAHRRKESTAAE